jgi:hypothetical protein
MRVLVSRWSFWCRASNRAGVSGTRQPPLSCSEMPLLAASAIMFLIRRVELPRIPRISLCEPGTPDCGRLFRVPEPGPRVRHLKVPRRQPRHSGQMGGQGGGIEEGGEPVSRVRRDWRAGFLPLLVPTARAWRAVPKFEPPCFLWAAAAMLTST